MEIKIGHIAWICLAIFFFGCKKKENRSCWKGHGEETAVEIPLDSVASFDLGKNITYRIFQDDQRKVVIRAGENMVNLIDVNNENDTLYIENNNKCHFLRDDDRKVEVEIHYPHYKSFYIIPSDSVIFENTIVSDHLKIELREAGGSMVLDTDVGLLQVVVSLGTADFKVSGHANYAELKMYQQGYGNALELQSNNILAYQNSTANLKVNLEASNALVEIQGVGDVLYVGSPSNLELKGDGSGNLLEM